MRSRRAPEITNALLISHMVVKLCVKRGLCSLVGAWLLPNCLTSSHALEK